MEKLNKCPMCGIHQLIKYSNDIVLPMEECFDMLQGAAVDHDTLKALQEIVTEFEVEGKKIWIGTMP
jgi:hypothetical protein